MEAQRLANRIVTEAFKPFRPDRIPPLFHLGDNIRENGTSQKWIPP